MLVDDLSREIYEQITQALTIPNLVKLNAKKQQLWNWEQMPDDVVLYQVDQGQLIMPRGFLLHLVQGLELNGLEYSIHDHRTWNAPKAKLEPCFELFPWQVPAMETLSRMQQGFYKAPAGSGKTATVLGLVDKLQAKSLIIVNTKDILWQWRSRIETFLGSEIHIGQIGDGKFEVSEQITVATAQTLHSRYDKLEAAGFFDEFDIMCIDEAHHSTANTYNKLVDRFSSRYRIGVSATPDKTGDFALAQSVLGPIVHTTTPDQVSNLMKPEVIKVQTSFFFPFHPTKSRWQRSNYPQMIEAMITDPQRNQLIVDQVMKNARNHNLLVTKRIEHIDILESMLAQAGYPEPILRLTGQDKNEHREHVVAYANESPCIVLSTLADEALDIPRLDRIYLVFSQRNPGLIVQQVGRVERVHPDKKDAKIYDFADNVGPLAKQWQVRRFEVYEPRQYKITIQKA